MACEELRKTILRFSGDGVDRDLLVLFESHIERCGGQPDHGHLRTQWLLFVRRPGLCLCAPAKLRRRILGSFPHRRATAVGGT